MAVKFGDRALALYNVSTARFTAYLRTAVKRGVIIPASCYRGLCPNVTTAFKRSYNLWSPLSGIIGFSLHIHYELLWLRFYVAVMESGYEGQLNFTVRKSVREIHL